MEYISLLLRRLFPPGAWKPGYWGEIPYLLVLRCATAIGIWLRFWINATGGMPAWSYLALLCAFAFAFVVHGRPGRYTRLLYSVLVLVDIEVISHAYWST